MGPMLARPPAHSLNGPTRNIFGIFSERPCTLRELVAITSCGIYTECVYNVMNFDGLMLPLFSSV